MSGERTNAKPTRASGVSRSPRAPVQRRRQPGVGNQALQRALGGKPVQAKLEVNAPGDVYEQEADRVADAVMRQDAPKKDEDKKVARQAAAAPKKDEDKKVARQAAPAPKKDEDKKVARQAAAPKKDEDKKVARQAAAPKKDEDKKVARQAAGNVPAVTPAVESGIEGARGAGHRIPQPTRDFLEPRLGHDLSAVRLHTDSQAAGLARRLDANAFTTGRDIFFAEGRYQPHTGEGQRLLAHEVAHTIQQDSSGALRRHVQRVRGTASKPLVDLKALPKSSGQRSDTTKALLFDDISIPGFKQAGKINAGQWAGGAGWPLTRKAGYTREEVEDVHVTTWRDDVAMGPVGLQNAKTKLKERLKAKKLPELEDVSYRYETPEGSIVEGNMEQVARASQVPTWGKTGNTPQSYQIDHIRELQLANYKKQGKAHEAQKPDNLWLLDGPINMQAGTDIAGEVTGKVSEFSAEVLRQYRTIQEGAGEKAPAREAKEALAEDLKRSNPGLLSDDETRIDVRKAMKNYDLEFDKASPKLGPKTVPRPKYWTKQEILEGEHLERLEPKPKAGKDEIVVYTEEIAGATAEGKAVEVAGRAFVFNKAVTPTPRERTYFTPLAITAKRWEKGTGASLGTLEVDVLSGKKLELPGAPREINVKRAGDSPSAGVLDKASVLKEFGRLQSKVMSPIEVQQADLVPGQGFTVRGLIKADIPVLREGINFEVSKGDLRVYKEFDTGAFNVPKPFSIGNSTLTLSAGTDTGLSVTGRIDFGIAGVGEGMLQAKASTVGGFELEGGFDFDTQMFKPARANIKYSNGKWSGGGTIGIPEGRVKGIKSASVTVTYEEGRLEATGTANLTVPGVQSGALRLTYSEAEGFSFGGSFALKDDIPGIKSGSVEATVRRGPTGAYSISAKGEAVPDIPGVDARLLVSYDDGAFLIEGTASYSKGMLSGSLTVGATNRPVGADGKPAGEPTSKLTAWGGGTVTIKIAPWLQGTVGLRLLPNGEIEVSGEIALPSAIDLFPEKSYTKNIFKIGIDIPIVGVSVLGHRIGIFATIQGGLDLDAGVGPGQIQQLALGVTYNPAHEDQTHVTGTGRLHVPAHAGLRLFVRGGLGAGIPIVSATATLEVGGRLGLEGAVEAGVDVDWTPVTGLAIDALGEIHVEPKFRFDITGRVLVEADLLFSTIELYSHSWELASFEWGSGLRLGMKLPIKYREGQPFDVSWNDVEFEVPDIDPKQVLSGLIDQIA